MEHILDQTGQTLRSVDGLERYINKISGVISSKIVTDQNGKIVEVHVLSDFTRAPKQIVRDIQSCAAAVFNLQLEYKTVSIAQIEQPLKVKARRLKLRNFNVVSDGNRLTVKACLSNGDKIYEGMAEGFNQARGRYMVAAEACIQAVHTYLDMEFIFHVTDVQQTQIAGMTSHCVAVSYCRDDVSGLLLGSSLQKEDEYGSIIRATLDAVNRILDRIAGEQRKSREEPVK